MTSSQEKEPVDSNLFFQQETSPYQPDKIEVVRGAMPAFIRYMPHAIILWSVGYVLYQSESNYINYITAVLLVLWSTYNLIAMKKKWSPIP
ncbi:MAG: hypothetical protein HYR94_09980 [Chloroflexi bacterium]|nr:hypothetical protein [Chloroflexota bacterium]